MTNVAFAGVVGTDVRLAQTNGNIPVCSFRMAVNERIYNQQAGQWMDGPTSWYTVTAYNQLALNIAASLSKGQRVNVIGRQQVRDWETADRNGTSVEITATSVGVDLLYGTAEFTRVVRTASQPTIVAQKRVTQQQLDIPVENDNPLGFEEHEPEHVSIPAKRQSKRREAATSPEGD